MSTQTPITDTAPAETGPLSLDDAISVLSAADEPEADEIAAAEEDEVPEDDEATAEADADAGDEEDTELEASDQEAGEDDAPEDDPASEEDAEDAEDEPEAPAIEPPKFWSAEEKAVFAKAPPEVQQVIVAREAEFSRQVSLAKEETARARKDAEIISEFGDKIGAVLERARTIFQGKWDGMTPEVWMEWFDEDPQAATKAKAKYDFEQAELQKLETAQAATEAETHRQFIQAESLKLAEAVPALADATEGKARKSELVSMLSEDGFSADDLKWAGAKELRIAWEALQYRKLNARATANPPKTAAPKKTEPAKATAAKPAPTPTTATVRPTAAPPPRKSVIQRRKAEVVSTAMKTGRMDDAVAAVLAMEG